MGRPPVSHLLYSSSNLSTCLWFFPLNPICTLHYSKLLKTQVWSCPILCGSPQWSLLWLSRSSVVWPLLPTPATRACLIVSLKSSHFGSYLFTYVTFHMSGSFRSSQRPLSCYPKWVDRFLYWVPITLSFPSEQALALFYCLPSAILETLSCSSSSQNWPHYLMALETQWVLVQLANKWASNVWMVLP